MAVSVIKAPGANTGLEKSPLVRREVALSDWLAPAMSRRRIAKEVFKYIVLFIS
jgi:hypothetical protein